MIKYLATVTKNLAHGSEHIVNMIAEDDAIGGTLQKFPHPSKPQCHPLTSYNLCSLEKNILFSRDFIFSKVSLGSSLQLLERSLRGSFLYGGEPVNQ